MFYFSSRIAADIFCTLTIPCKTGNQKWLITQWTTSNSNKKSNENQVNYWKTTIQLKQVFKVLFVDSHIPWAIFTSRSSYTSAVLGIIILSVRPFFCLSITRVLCDETKENTADILIPREKLITLVFWCQQKFMGNVPFYLKFALKVTTPPLETLKSTNICL